VTFILQRRLTGARHKWRSVLRFTPGDHERITQAVELLAPVDLCHWRVVEDDNLQTECARWDGERWAKV
jgi:hypothetical protein